jgi:hypothetical protein
MKVHSHSSQTVFLPRQFSFSSGNHTPNGHVFSSRTSALRAASSGPSAVGPDGPMDLRDSSPDTTVVLPITPVDGKRPRGGVWQDKAVREDGPEASSQPGPDTIVARAAVLDTGSVRSQNASDAKERLVKGAVWMKPGVKEALEGLADQTGLSFSATAAKGLEIYARAKIKDQEDSLFEPRMQAMMRREIQSSDNRHVPFEIKNAIAAEQTRILTADLYKRMLLKEGIPLKEINAKMDAAYNLARANIFKTKTPKFKALLAEWKRIYADLPESTGEAGTPGD